MEAVVIQACGPPAESLAVRSEPVPEPGPGEVLVEVHAAGVNPFGGANALGFLGAPPPTIPGLDYAAAIVSDGEHAGQEVWGAAPELGLRRPGTHARFVALPETWLSRKPERLTMTEAAAVAMPYLAAWETVIERGQLAAGETLLITGGSGLVRALFGPGVLTAPAIKTWPLKNSAEAYQTVLHCGRNQAGAVDKRPRDTDQLALSADSASVPARYET